MQKDVIVGIIAFILIFLLESLLPARREQRKTWSHTTVNLLMAGLSFVITILFIVLTVKAMNWAAANQWGLLNIFDVPLGWRIVIAVVFFDLWMYLWHRANHRIFFLWRFHRMHHTDLAMDSTTALRFHPAEIIFSTLCNIAVFVILGLHWQDYVIYKMIYFPVILFHHSNLRINDRCDSILKSLIVTPNMHRVHHSIKYNETNSNYGTIFSFWDRLIKSFRHRDDIPQIRFGIGILEGPKWQKFPHILFVPFSGRKRR